MDQIPQIIGFVNSNGPHYPRRIKGAKEALPKIYLPPRLTHQKSFSSWSHVALRALRTLWKKSIKWLFANKRISQRGEGGRRPSDCLVTWSTCRARRLSYEVQSDCGFEFGMTTLAMGRGIVRFKEITLREIFVTRCSDKMVELAWKK